MPDGQGRFPPGGVVLDTSSTRRLTPDGRIIIGPGFPPDFNVPIPLNPDFIKNIFEKSRPGRPVVRTTDLLAMRVELRNIDLNPGQPPVLKANGGSARLILHFPPQAITEETFFEVPPTLSFEEPEAGSKAEHPNPNKPESNNPSGSEALRPPPVRARIADESRLVFKVPDGTEIEYTLAGILEACGDLELVVAKNARPRLTRGYVFDLADLFDTGVLSTLANRSRVALAAQAASALRIGGSASGGLTTLRARHAMGGAGLNVLPDDLFGELRPFPGQKPRPGNPSDTTSAIELPWRLIISPHAGGRWRHASLPMTSATTGHTELWHTQLVTPRADGTAVLPPYPDPNRTIRAIWARAGSGTEAMDPDLGNGQWPQDVNAIPPPSQVPFRMPMDNNDRFQVVHLSSNFQVTGYTPQPIDTQMLMLSSLGGWLDSRGAWDPPGLSVEEWVHRASMARDHYVKVVYRGFLYPFGHRVSLVKVTERKFHNGKATHENEPGNTAYLRQRFYLVIREKLRTFDDAAFHATQDNDGDVKFAHQFPLTSVEILLDVTPDLNDPADSEVTGGGGGRLMFWPFVAGQPFRLPCVGTDLDGRRVLFDLPMIFMDNTRACPRTWNESTEKLDPDFVAADEFARAAQADFAARTDRNHASFDGQRLAIAPPMKSGDTTVQAMDVVFGGEASEIDSENPTLHNYSADLTRPVFVPKIVSMKARIGVMSNLTGTQEDNTLEWNARYLRLGFNDQTGANGNQGEVFVDVVSGKGQMDFSAQGDRSGGFMQPNLKPRGLSRFAGPVMADVDTFAAGELEAGAGFDGNLGDLPLPLLFGCIPLGALLGAVTDLAGESEKIPKFVQEGGSKLEMFVNTLVRLHGMVVDLVTDPASVGDALIAQARQTLEDLLAQAAAYAPPLVQPSVDKINSLITDIDVVTSALSSIAGTPIDEVDDGTLLQVLDTAVDSALDRLGELRDTANTAVGGVSLPAGFRQSILNLCQTLETALEALRDIAGLATAGRSLFDALEDIVGDPAGIGALFEDETELTNRLNALSSAIGDFRDELEDFDLINGSFKTSLLNTLGDLQDVLGVVADIAEVLLGDEITIRFDWNPKISSFPASAPIFRANDERGLLVAVEGKVKKNGNSDPKISVVCSLRAFDLVLIAPASFIELQFDRIEFSVDSKAKMDVDVMLNEIKFVGPLSFVETLKDLIPLDGFSDPPYLDITPQGIDAGFDIALPTVAVGVLNLSNMSLGAGFTVPFIGQPLSVRFNFCTREQPFCLTVYMFGGGGFFGITIDPSGVQILEAAFEFGAAISIDLGVASGGVEVMAGLYFRIESDEATLVGYFRLGGHVDVLGLISASLELYLSLTYETSSGKCTGRAELTIEVEVFVFSGSVTVSCERKFSGANGDPSLRQMMGHSPALSLEDELDGINGPGVGYAWKDYVEAFA